MRQRTPNKNHQTAEQSGNYSLFRFHAQDYIAKVLNLKEPTRGEMAELADAADSKSAVVHSTCRFDPDFRHHLLPPFTFMPKKWNFYVKVLIVEEEEGDVNPDRVTREITRQLQKIYGVRNAEVTNVTTD